MGAKVPRAPDSMDLAMRTPIIPSVSHPPPLLSAPLPSTLSLSFPPSIVHLSPALELALYRIAAFTIGPESSLCPERHRGRRRGGQAGGEREGGTDRQKESRTGREKCLIVALG